MENAHPPPPSAPRATTAQGADGSYIDRNATTLPDHAQGPPPSPLPATPDEYVLQARQTTQSSAGAVHPQRDDIRHAASSPSDTAQFCNALRIILDPKHSGRIHEVIRRMETETDGTGAATPHLSPQEAHPVQETGEGCPSSHPTTSCYHITHGITTGDLHAIILGNTAHAYQSKRRRTYVYIHVEPRTSEADVDNAQATSHRQCFHGLPLGQRRTAVVHHLLTRSAHRTVGYCHGSRRCQRHSG